MAGRPASSVIGLRFELRFALEKFEASAVPFDHSRCDLSVYPPSLLFRDAPVSLSRRVRRARSDVGDVPRPRRVPVAYLISPQFLHVGEVSPRRPGS